MVLRPSRLVKPLGTTMNFTSDSAPLRGFTTFRTVSPSGFMSDLFHMFRRTFVGNASLHVSAALSSWNWTSCSFTVKVALTLRVRNCAFLVANATKNFALATRISQPVASGRLTISCHDNYTNNNFDFQPNQLK